MKRISYRIAAMVVPGILILWSIAAWGSDYELGKTVYEGRCQFCHGIKGNGNGPAAASLNPKPADFNDPKFWQQYDKQKMSDVIRNGRRMMPAFDLKPNETEAIIEYMTRTFKK